MQSGMKSEPGEGLCVRMPGEEQPVFLLMKAGARPTLYTAVRKGEVQKSPKRQNTEAFHGQADLKANKN